jgi:hypothetical protein
MIVDQDEWRRAGEVADKLIELIRFSAAAPTDSPFKSDHELRAGVRNISAAHEADKKAFAELIQQIQHCDTAILASCLTNACWFERDGR